MPVSDSLPPDQPPVKKAPETPTPVSSPHSPETHVINNIDKMRHQRRCCRSSGGSLALAATQNPVVYASFWNAVTCPSMRPIQEEDSACSCSGVSPVNVLTTLRTTLSRRSCEKARVAGILVGLDALALAFWGVLDDDGAPVYAVRVRWVRFGDGRRATSFRQA